MRSLPVPAPAAADVFATCIGKIRDKDLKGRLAAVSAEVVAASLDFSARSAAKTLHQVAPDTPIGAVAISEMVNLYDRSMAKAKSAGRGVYDQIKAAAPNGRCPLCGQRDVSTLDHHLPKTRFPALTVVPVNLIPACKDCNKTKGEHFPASPEEHSLHPYFDNVEGETWLTAEVVSGQVAAVRFRPMPPAAWSAVTRERVRHHFELFKLGSLYTSHAADHMRMLKARLARLSIAGGAQAVGEHLAEEAIAWQSVNRNCWEAALCSALHSSPWYCNGGFASVA